MIYCRAADPKMNRNALELNVFRSLILMCGDTIFEHQRRKNFVVATTVSPEQFFRNEDLASLTIFYSDWSAAEKKDQGCGSSSRRGRYMYNHTIDAGISGILPTRTMVAGCARHSRG